MIVDRPELHLNSHELIKQPLWQVAFNRLWRRRHNLGYTRLQNQLVHNC